MNEPFIETLRRCPPSELPALRQSLEEQLATANRYRQQSQAILNGIQPELDAMKALKEVQVVPGYSGSPADDDRLQALKGRHLSVANTVAGHRLEAATIEARLRILDASQRPPASALTMIARSIPLLAGGLTMLAVLYIASPWIAGFFLAACLVVVIAGRHR